MITSGNILADLPDKLDHEQFDPLLDVGHMRIERIVSIGQATAPGEWYDQDEHEWVLLIRGAAQILFESEGQPRDLRPGDYVFIPAHARHRVTWTSPKCPTVWLALHLQPHGP